MDKRTSDYQAVLVTPFGKLGVVVSEGYLLRIDLLAVSHPKLSPTTAGAAQVVVELQNYLQNPTAPLDVRLKIDGSDFQQKVWRLLQQIPVGKTQTYGELAAVLNSSARAVGNACRSNPCPLVIPCHRVVGKTGLGGFSGKTSGPMLELKRWLLKHEGVL